MASLDDVLKGNLRGYRRETGQPVEEVAVEEPAIDEVEPPQLYDERAEYRGFKVPAGMDAEQTERWFGAIDAREDEREAAEAEAEAEFEAESGFMTQFTGSLERTVMKDNPRMGAKAVEGLGRVAGSQAMIDFGSKTAAEYDTSDDPAAFSPRIESIYDAEGFQDYIDYAGSTLGQGVASIGTMVAGGAAGAAAGAPLGLSAVTAPVGAFTAGFIQNYGDLYDTLVDQEGMDPDDAAKYALIPAGIMGALDTTGVIKIVKPARDGLSRNLVKRTAQLAIRGGGNEAVTEAAQQVVQESAGEIAEVTGLATKDIEFSQRFENVVNALVAGFIPGFTLGGASAVRVRPEDDAPAPPATPSVSPVVDPERVIDDSGFSLAADKQRSVFRVDSVNQDGQIREIVVVTMPDGSSKAFYNSTGTTDPSKGTAGMWIPFEGFAIDARMKESEFIGDTPYTYSILAKTFWNQSGYEGTVRPFPGTQLDEASKWINKYIDAKGGSEAVFSDSRLVQTASDTVQGSALESDRKRLGAINRFLYSIGAIDRSAAVLRIKDGTRRKQFGLDEEAPKPQEIVSANMEDVAAEVPDAATAGAKAADDISARFPDASDVVDGRKVINADNVPNMSSIDSSLDDYEILPGIREVSMDEFPSLDGRHYSAQGTKRIKDLEQEIASTGEITPLIVVIDDDGPYILEGATRSEALYRAGAKSFPAKVVIDKSAKPPAPDAATAGAETESEIAEARRLWQEMGIESPYFKRKFGNTKVVDDDGKPLAVFHGTSGDFNEFRPGSPDSAFGSAIYTSSSTDDVNVNYATAEGPDIKNRVEQAIDRIEDLNDFDDDDILDAAKRYMDRTESTDTELLEAIKAGDVEKLIDDLEPDLIEQLARQQVLGDEAFSVLKTYVNIENPVYLDPSGTKGRTTFDLEIEYDEDGEFVGESGSVLELLEAIEEVADDLSTYQIGGRGPYSDDVDKLKTFIGENSIDGEIDALDLFEEVRGGNYYFESDTGGPENTEFIRKVFDKMGFDGIIADAYHFFGPRRGPMGVRLSGMEGVTPGTYHYMAFKPEQIKSATGNVGTFDPSGNILKQSEDVTPQTSEGQQYVGLGGLSVEEAIDASKSISTGVELAEFIIENADNKDYKEIAKRLIPHLEETDVHTLTGDVNDLPQWVFESEKKGTLSRNIVNSLAGMSAHHTRLRYATKGLNVSRQGDPYNDVFIRGRPVYSGATAETMLHELIHAATVRRQADGNLAANEGTKLQKASSKIIQLRNDVVQVAKKAQRDGSLDSEMESMLVRATENDKEFIAYGMTNKKFQEFLMTIKSKNKSIWNRFVEAVAGLLGISKDNQTALSDLILATDELLSAPLDEVPLRPMTESIEMMSQPAEDALPEDIEKKLNEAAEAGTITREEAMEARREWRNKGTDSSFFKKWFRESSVVDSKGKPLRVLHGTASKFDVFSISGDRVGLLGQGVYTSLNEGVANYYASPARNRGKEIVGPPTARYPVMGNVIPGYVSIQNPVFTKDPLDKKVVEEMKEWIETRRKGTIDVSSKTGTVSYVELLGQIEDIAYRGSGNSNVNHTGMQRVLVKILKSNGYDGVINTTRDEFDKLQKNDFEDAPSNMHIVVLEPNQFKSDIGNLGTFSLVDDEMFFQREEIPGAQYFSDEAFDRAQQEARPEGSRFIVGEIALDDFLALAAEGMEESKAKSVADLVEGGTKFNTLPFLEFDKSGKVITHEGRHRARALKELGVERMPILFESENIRWQKQSDPRERAEFPKFLIGQDSDFKIKFPFDQPDVRKEEGNPAEELGPVILSQRVDSPVDTVVMYTDDVSRSKAELDRRREIRNKYEPLLFELMKLESEFYEKDDRSEEVKKLGYQYEDLLKQYAQIDDELFADEYDRFLKGGDFYYETMEEGLEDFDVDRGFEVMSGAPDIMMDIELRSTQEEMQRKRFDRMMERGGTLVDLAGKNSPINRLILQKAKTFNHPVQTVQLIESDKVQLQEDLNNVEELKEDGLISYLLYKELKGDVMLF